MHPQFPQDKNLIYLNHAAISPWPLCTRLAIEKFAVENVTFGARNYPQWLKTETQLRHRLSRLINAGSADDIALLKSTSEALSVVAYGLNWQDGDNVVLSSQEFPSNKIVWESLKRFGVEIRMVNFTDNTYPEQDLIQAIDSNTKLLTSSSVHYASGLRINLQKLGEHCQKNNVLFCVDAIQSLGAVPFDLKEIQADFVMADGHKWMMAAEGLALFYCKPELREQLKLQQYGWHMLENNTDYQQTTWQAAKSAKRFECGSPNMLGAHALNASLGLIEEIGIEQIHTRLMQNMALLIDKLKSINNIQFHSPVEQLDSMAGIVNFSIESRDSELLYRSLMQQNVICAQRGAGVRFSPHFYQDENLLDDAIRIVKAELNKLK